MAITEVKQESVPPLPPELRQLSLYLLRRDIGAPAPGLDCYALQQQAVGASTLDRIAWAYVPRLGLDNVPADGVCVYWGAGAGAAATDGGVMVGTPSGAYSMLWPTGETRSYAIAGYRITAQGIELGPAIQHATWIDIT